MTSQSYTCGKTLVTFGGTGRVDDSGSKIVFQGTIAEAERWLADAGCEPCSGEGRGLGWARPVTLDPFRSVERVSPDQIRAADGRVFRVIEATDHLLLIDEAVEEGLGGRHTAIHVRDTCARIRQCLAN